MVFGLLLMSLSTTVKADEVGQTRQFIVDFSNKFLEEGDVQMCDDTYYSYAEIIIKAPQKDAGKIKKLIQSQCKGMKVKHDTVYNEELGRALRFTLDGNWDCEIKLPNQDGDKVYTITLSDAC